MSGIILTAKEFEIKRDFFTTYRTRFRYLDAQDDVTLIYDDDNVVLFEGMIDEVTDVSGSMNLNSQGKSSFW